MTEKLPLSPTVTVLQRAWLREIGMEKLWVRQNSSVAATTPATLQHLGNRVGAEGGNPRVQSVDSLPAQGVDPLPVQVLDNRPGQELDQAPLRRAHAAVDDQGPSRVREMEALRAQVATCTACGLCQSRKQAVFGEGAWQASWLILGEAPGEQEDRQGLPFVGRSGQLLTAMLAAIGIQRERDVFITNVIKCRPLGNRNPKPEEIAACRPYLMRQIALLKPARILVLGRFAAQTLLETDNTIGSLRGRVHQFKTETGTIPVVASYHPAYLLRSPTEKARSWQDLLLASRL